MGVETLERPNVARKKDAPDQHKSGFMIRLPEEYRALLKAMEAKTGRPFTVSTRLALEKLAKELGVKFTPSWPELL